MVTKWANSRVQNASQIMGPLPVRLWKKVKKKKQQSYRFFANRQLKNVEKYLKKKEKGKWEVEKKTNIETARGLLNRQQLDKKTMLKRITIIFCCQKKNKHYWLLISQLYIYTYIDRHITVVSLGNWNIYVTGTY